MQRANEMNPIVAIPHFIVIVSNIRIPRWASTAAMRKEGMKKAAIAEAATFGYASTLSLTECLPERKGFNNHIPVM